MNGRSGIPRGSAAPSPIPEAAAPPTMRFTWFTKENAIGEHDHGQLCGTTEKDRGQLMREIASPSRFTDDASALDTLTPRPDNSSDKDLQRAEGSCRIVLGSSERGTRVMDVYQKSPIRVLFPRMADPQVEEAVLVNTSGGIAG